jgi:hypothetical protein
MQARHREPPAAAFCQQRATAAAAALRCCDDGRRSAAAVGVRAPRVPSQIAVSYGAPLRRQFEQRAYLRAPPARLAASPRWPTCYSRACSICTCAPPHHPARPPAPLCLGCSPSWYTYTHLRHGCSSQYRRSCVAGWHLHHSGLAAMLSHQIRTCMSYLRRNSAYRYVRRRLRKPHLGRQPGEQDATARHRLSSRA